MEKKLLDLRETTNHPLSLRYSEIFNDAILTGSFIDSRCQPGMCLANNTPFVGAARTALAHGLDRNNTLSIMQDYLSQYYMMVTPDNASEWLGLKRNSQLMGTPPWGSVFPWRARTIESYQEAYEKAAWAENLAVGREVGISDGWLFCGPVSNEKIRIESERILYVLRRIYKEGYQRSESVDGDVKATAIVNDKHEWRWIITSGNHRASAAAALGMAEIPIRVNLVISRSDAIYWKHVVDGVFTLQEALSVFDNYFNADPVEVTHTWLDYIKRQK